MSSVLILFAHPAFQKSRINRALYESVQGLSGVTCVDLYEEYPHFHIDVALEQERLRQHHTIVFQHPFYWYSSPAILKEWQDLVLEYNFAYGPHGTALRGKQFLSAITTGGSEDAYARSGYNFFTINELLAPFEQTARLCGMEYLTPFIVHGALSLSAQHDIQIHAQKYRTRIETLVNDINAPCKEQG